VSVQAAETRRFVVVLRGPSAAFLGPEDGLTINGFPSSVGKADIVLRTRWVEHSEGVEYPGHLWIEAAGAAPTLEEAIPAFANAALALLPVVSFATNAAIGDPQIELAFETTPGRREREYFQQYVPPEGKQLFFARLMHSASVAAVAHALGSHSDSERLGRAMTQYATALNSWIMGRDTLCVAHLWMAVEALTKAAIRRECGTRKTATEKELASALGIDIGELDAFVRREIILKGDADCYAKARKASDGFEHGYLGFDDVRALAVETRTRMGKYVRESLLGMLDLPADVRARLLGSPFDAPMGDWTLVKYLRGALLADADELAPPESVYPFMKWAPSLTKCELAPTGELKIAISETYTAQLAHGVKFQSRSAELWRPS